MRLTTKGRFAVTAMIDLALREAHGPVTLAGISQRQHISLSYLEQIFSRLKKSGIWYERPVKHLRYTMTKHKKQAKNPERRKLLMDIKNDKRSYTDEGLNSVEYKLLSWTKYPLHTHLMVDVGEAPQKK